MRCKRQGVSTGTIHYPPTLTVVSGGDTWRSSSPGQMLRLELMPLFPTPEAPPLEGQQQHLHGSGRVSQTHATRTCSRVSTCCLCGGGPQEGFCPYIYHAPPYLNPGFGQMLQVFSCFLPGTHKMHPLLTPTEG